MPYYKIRARITNPINGMYWGEIGLTDCIEADNPEDAIVKWKEKDKKWHKTYLKDNVYKDIHTDYKAIELKDYQPEVLWFKITLEQAVLHFGDKKYEDSWELWEAKALEKRIDPSQNIKYGARGDLLVSQQLYNSVRKYNSTGSVHGNLIL